MEIPTTDQPRPLFSLIIPTYNREEFIVKTLQSALNQTFTDVEILVIDDGSTDNTEAVVQQMAAGHPQIKYFKKENEERAAARNYGTDRARGRYINFLDSDDLLYPNHFMEAFQMIILYHLPEIFHLAYEVRTADNRLLRSYTDRKNIIINDDLLRGNSMSCMGVFIRADIALKNKFNSARKLTTAEDWELWLRLAARYNIYAGNTITGCLVDHPGRSMAISDLPKAEKINETLQTCLQNDTVFMARYGHRLPHIMAHMETLLALRISRNLPWHALSYLLQGILKNPGELFTKRTLAILRNILPI